MKTLAQYLTRMLLLASALVMLVLLALAGFIEFVGELDDTGEGSYTAAGALLYTLLRLPQVGVEMLPVSALLGGLLGLGALAKGSELVAMRAAGISPRRLAQAVMIGGCLMALGGAIVSEYIAPPLDQFARKYRSAARNRADLSGRENTWVRDGQRIFNVESGNAAPGFGGVYLFELDDSQRLQSVAFASRADLDESGGWVLSNLNETRFAGRDVSATITPSVTRKYSIDAELLGIAALRPGSLSISGLLSYLDYLHANRLDARAYATEFWRRIADTLATAIMPVLAIGFVFGSLRSAGAGSRLLIGVLIGLGYFLASRTLANSGQVFSIDPALVGLAPVVVLGVVVLGVIYKVR
ncbi:MAG: LPS export ABC transporter permease LptG [Pseudomonadota bacterium]